MSSPLQPTNAKPMTASAGMTHSQPGRLTLRLGSRIAGRHQPTTEVTIVRYTAATVTGRTTASRVLPRDDPVSIVGCGSIRVPEHEAATSCGYELIDLTEKADKTMSEPAEQLEDGWNRFYVKSSGILQRDASVYPDESLENQMFAMVGDKRGAQIMDSDGTVVMTAVVTKGFLTKVEYTRADGAVAADLKTNSVWSKKHMELTLASRAEWVVVKSGALKQVYTVLADDVPIARMDLKTLPLKRHYPVDIAEVVDLPLAMGLVWAVNFSHLRRVAAAGAGAAAAG